MKYYFIQDFTKSKYKDYEFCLHCGVRTDIRDMDILKELHSDCWKWYRYNGIPYKAPRYY